MTVVLKEHLSDRGFFSPQSQIIIFGPTRIPLGFKTMMEKFGNDDQYLCASFDPTSDRFNPKQYWRGPVWVNVNWLIYHGLKRYRYKEISDRLKSDTIEIIAKNGFYEYFDSRKEMHKENNAGYGGNNFSWSAALIIDMIHTN